MVICEEETSESNTEAEEGAIVPGAKPSSKRGGSVLLQRKHSLSVTFLTNSQGAALNLLQAPEITRNFMTFLPSGSQIKLCLEAAQSTSHHPSKKDSVKMLGWNNTESTHRSQIPKTLREVVKRAVMEFRLSSSTLNLDDWGNCNDVVEAVPVSFRPPESTNMDMVLSPRKRVTTLLVGETLISFKLPLNCPFDPKDLDKLVEEERREAMASNANGENFINNNVPKYTLFQRLEGWKMERRQRVNGRFDMYYHHLQSKRTFRSITELVNFFLYEVYPDKPQRSASKPKLGGDDLSGKKLDKKEKRVTPLKRKMDESRKSREKILHTIYDLGGDDQKAYDDHNLTYDVVGDNYQNTYDHKETVEKFLAEAYDNLMNWPHDKKHTSFSFDINEECEGEDGNFNPNNQTVEELVAEAYNNLLNYSNSEAKLPKGKEKRSRSIEKPRRKKLKTFTPTSFPSFPSTPSTVSSIPIEKKREKEQKKEKEKITDTVESMKVEDKASVANTKHKRFNIKEANGNVIFSDVVDCEPNCAAAVAGGGGGGSSSAMEVAKSVAFSDMDECDLINHIPESSDMFDLAMFLTNNRGNGGF